MLSCDIRGHDVFDDFPKGRKIGEIMLEDLSKAKESIQEIE